MTRWSRGAGRYDGPALHVRGEGCGAPLGRRRGRKRICAHRGAASVVGVGGESSPGAEGVQRYNTEENRRIRDPYVRWGGGGGDGGRESPSYPISGGSSNTTAAIAAAISSRSSRPPSRNP